MAEQTQTADLGFDPDALRDKYRQERDKRLRADGNEQYVEIKDTYAHYLDDPYVERFEREPLTDEVEVAVIGGGFGGLLAGARLREAGVEDIRMIEKGGDFGGTWYWNRYPGAACDVESYVYLPLLEEVGYIPKEKYSGAPEILEHSRAIGRHFDLYRDVCFQTEVTEMRWDEATAHWVIHTNRGDAMRARYVVMANGPLHRPKLPGIPGVESYKGHSFHTSRWDYDYTGGTSDGGLDRIGDKVIGVIGTGATAVQCVPHLAAGAKQLLVFQRTPSSIDIRNNRPTDQDWAESLEPGWHKHRMENFNTLVSGGFAEEDLVNDGWTDIIRNLLLMVQHQGEEMTPEKLMETMELADFQKMESIRARCEEVVADPNTAESLKPYYRQFCKRPCFHDEYLKAYNNPNVTLIDTNGLGVERITEKGVVVDGTEYELDCLVYATGFEVGTEYTRRSGYEVYGRDNLSLTEKWEDGVRTLHGMTSRGFPNCFIIQNSQSAFTVNFPHAMDEQSKHLSYIIKHGLDHQIRALEPSEEAEENWVQTIIGLARGGLQFLEECTLGYYNNEGKPAERASAQNGPYGAGPNAYFQVIADWREAGDLEGLELTGK
jgi:cyclohexanone monooxygenase